MNADLRADTVVAMMAAQIEDGDVVATGVASTLAILAIAVARATTAPNLTYLACVGSIDPDLSHLHRSPEELAYLEGRTAEISIPELFDHARRGRIDTIFFGAAEVDGQGRTNMSAAGSLARPKPKFPGLAGAASLRRWVKKPVLVVPRQSRRNLVPEVQVASTNDERRTMLVTDLAVFETGLPEARLVARHPWASEAEIADKTGFRYTTDAHLAVTSAPDERTLRAIRSIDSQNQRHALVG
ncbi:3-oxoadipate CoA-transferase subunit B [Labilithrix luteola]|uniref:3-oxoadipate CoA-transferase subunit B n=1 Tax=Labilithrix luteola TaxID=1391654 RepID=A0A0K1PS35_9BACT|nr:CoA-transferase [Labilithrix luteola]AKU96345.1 3-oxoadipate CoA-transferase subunit B [Labilithrix luteola]